MLQINEFTFSTGWLDLFKERFNIKQYKISGEAASVDLSQVASGITKQFLPCDVFNLDETALFLKLQPNTTLSTV